MRRAAAVAAALGLLASAQGVLAQFSPGARSVGMGGAGMVYASGVDAIEWNPANLALGGGWSISLGEVGAAALLSGVELDDFQSFLEDDSTASQVVADLPASGLSLATVTEGYLTGRAATSEDLPGPGSPLPTIGVTFGSIGVRIRSRMMTEARLSKELADLVVNPFDPSQMQNYRVGDTGLRSASFSEVTAAYGTTVGERLQIGVGIRYVKGHKLTEVKFFEPVLDFVNESADITAAAVESAGGSGYGLDVGLGLNLVAGLRLSASATNVMQKMSWDEELIGYEYTYFACDCPSSDFELEERELVDLLRLSGQPIDPASMSVPVYQTAADLFPGAFFPTVVRAGLGWSAGGTALELVGTSVSPRGRQHSQWDERISLGVEQRLWFLTLRAGGAKGTDGLQTVSGGLGLGLGPVHFDVSGGLMSGGFDFASGVVAPENVDYAGGQVTASLQIIMGG